MHGLVLVQWICAVVLGIAKVGKMTLGPVEAINHVDIGLTLTGHNNPHLMLALLSLLPPFADLPKHTSMLKIDASAAPLYDLMSNCGYVVHALHP